MKVDLAFLNSDPVNLLCGMFAQEATRRSLFRKPIPHVPSGLNAIGACAGFAAQAAVWRELILPTHRNPGDFLVHATTKSGEKFLFGDAINLILYAAMADRVSFLSVAGTILSNRSELPDIPAIARHVTQTIGGSSFGRPRLPPSVAVTELPQTALLKTWEKVAHILRERRPAEWPAFLGAAAFRVMHTNQASLAPSLALTILLEAAIPMSKLDPSSVDKRLASSVSFTGWTPRALKPENHDEILAEVRGVMPVLSSDGAGGPPIVIRQPRVCFLNCGGDVEAARMSGDRDEIARAFAGRGSVVAGAMPQCDVLFAYGAVQPSGHLAGWSDPLRELVAKSGAVIAVVASEVPQDIVRQPDFQKAMARNAHPPANFVITFNRNGAAFSRFFRLLFEQMWQGVPMPSAWVRLAPQGPQQSPDVPGTICLMEAGAIVFATTA